MNKDEGLVPFVPLDINESIAKAKIKKCNANTEIAPIVQIGVQVKRSGFALTLNAGVRRVQTIEILFFE